MEKVKIMRKAFSLIELLVVIAVIGILAGMLLPKINRAIDSAQEATCRANMKNLYAATINYSIANGRLLPWAGSHVTTNDNYGTHSRQIGWVSWYSTTTDNMLPATLDQNVPILSGTVVQDVRTNPNLIRGNTALDTIRYGSLFGYAGEDVKIYRCPVAARALGGTDVRLTYVMNGFLGFEDSGFRSWRQYPNLDWVGGQASTTILFTERPSTSQIFNGNNGVLHPGDKAWVNDKPNNTPPADTLGTYHRSETGAAVGMVVFFDGHIVKVPATAGTTNVVWYLTRGDDSVLP